jgi:diguanylate cyclase (GGDEF)-like protein/PAS domain S-box-containing protein
MHILFVEENARDYLKARQLLDEQTSELSIDWAPNYDIALKHIKKNRYDVYLIGYEAQKTQQQKFLTWLYKSTSQPTILLTKHDESVDSVLLDREWTETVSKEQLSWPLLERIVRYLSNLIFLQKQEHKFETIFNKAIEFMGLLKANGILHEINQAALTLMGCQREQVIGQPFWEVPLLKEVKKTQEEFKSAIATAAKGEFAQCDIEAQKEAGQTTTLNFLLTPITNFQKEIVWILVEGRDLCERRALEQQLNHSTLHDQVTGLPNRHLFMEHLEQAIVRAHQRKDYRIAVLLLDLDRFRVINASLGHDMGDWLLMEITRRLQGCLTQNAILARADGDGFMILLDEIADMADATRLAVTINEVLGGSFLLDGYEVVSSCSIGIAYYNAQQDAMELLRDADAAMYRAKAMGKSGYAVFREGMHHHAISRLKIETELHQAFKKKDFILFYQPQTELSSDQLVGTESLIRYRHPENGLVSAIDFVSVLEDTGIIIPIGEWILQTACQQLKAWWEAELFVNRIAVNLSPYQFRSKRLVNIIAQALDNSGLEPKCLELELTENLVLEDIHSAIKILERFKEIGIRVTIDAFGTGYGSLNYLKQIPADCLKIDKSFIHGVMSSPADATITVATIDMAHALGLTVIAQGVETIEQRDFLRDHGCDIAQGYLYAPPMENTDFLQWGKEYNDNTIDKLE